MKQVDVVRIRRDGTVGGLVPAGVFFAALAQKIKEAEVARGLVDPPADGEEPLVVVTTDAAA